MEANHTSYDLEESLARVGDILDSAAKYEEVDEIPARDALTYTNGFYVNCTALFIDIRDSSKLPETHSRPVLGKLYRAFISECVAIMNDHAKCAEIFINGDCVSSIHNSPFKSDIDHVFEYAGRLRSFIDLFNFYLAKKQYKTITCGIGLAYGRALMLKSGARGSGIHDVVWMGDVVNEASNLCHRGNKDGLSPVQLSKDIYLNLKEEYQGFCTGLDFSMATNSFGSYQANVWNILMNARLTQMLAA